jgi:hypothetical protein
LGDCSGKYCQCTGEDIATIGHGLMIYPEHCRGAVRITIQRSARVHATALSCVTRDDSLGFRSRKVKNSEATENAGYYGRSI